MHGQRHIKGTAGPQGRDRMPWGRRRRSQRGSALMLALAAVLIISLLIFGVATSATQDHSLAHTEMDAAAALNAAEAAANWEQNKLSRVAYDPTITIDQKENPYVGPLPSDANGLPGPRVSGRPTIPGTVTVYVRDSSGTTDAPLPAFLTRIYASGTVNGVTRSVQVYVYPVGPGDVYSLYGIDKLNLAGTAALSGWIGGAGQIAFPGNVFKAGNATVLLDDSNGKPAFWLGLPAFGWDWLPTGTNTPLPTVDQIAQFAKAQLGGAGPVGGVDYFKANNDNNTQIMARDILGNVALVNWPASDVNHTRLDGNLFAANPLKTIVLVGNGALVGDKPHGSDFYFDNIDIPLLGTLEIQNGVGPGQVNGPVRLWLGPGQGVNSGLKFDFTRGILVVDDLSLNAGIKQVPDPQYFRIYNGSTTTLNVGNIVALDTAIPPDLAFYGSIYDYNIAPNGKGYGTVRIMGLLVNLQGSIVGWNVAQTAGTLLAALPAGSNGGKDLTKFASFYRLQGLWTETDPAGNASNPGSQSGFW